MTATKAQSLTEVAAVCDLLSDKTRMHIVFLLAKGESNVGDLVKILKTPQPNASHHLGLLRMGRLIIAKRKGKEIFYSLAGNVKVSSGKIKITLPSNTVTIDGC
jgi:DNA-binding transcriptional ArsR family regulator